MSPEFAPDDSVDLLSEQAASRAATVNRNRKNFVAGIVFVMVDASCRQPNLERV